MILTFLSGFFAPMLERCEYRAQQSQIIEGALLQMEHLDAGDSVKESKPSARLGWVIAGAFLLHSILLSILPRVDKLSPLREDLRGLHYALGIVLLVLVAMRLWRWAREPKLLQDSGLGQGQQLFNRAISLTWLISLLVAGVLGPIYGWAGGKVMHMAGLFDLPVVMGKDHAAWMFSGYFHAASALFTSLLALAVLGSGVVSILRHGKGVIASFPAGIGAMVVSSFLVTVYVFNSFQGPKNGLIAVAVVGAILLAISFFVIRRKDIPSAAPSTAVGGQSAGIVARITTFATLAIFLAAGAYAPYKNYGVVPWAMGEVVEADPDITWHQERLVEVAVAPSDALQEAAERDAYKWCQFCHTMRAGEAHLIGPNLQNIIGQRAGTAPNYHYSEAMAQAGRDGLVWDEETIKQFIAGPEKLVPGNRMIVNRGPVSDPAERDAVLNLLKRDAMTDSE